MSKVSCVTLNNGLKVPSLGLGTWKSKPGEVKNAVFHSIKNGYRHIDCAAAYLNEDEVGKAIKEAIDSGCCNREDLFITTKLWNTFHRKDLVVPALKTQLQKLGLDYVDLYLMHWPMAYQEGEIMFPKYENGHAIPSSDPNSKFTDTWEAMEDCVKSNLSKSIGLSNFNSEQIDTVLKSAKIKPAMLQIESHPYFNNDKLIKFAKDRGITVTAYSPFGSPDRPWATKGETSILEDENVKKMAEKYGKSTGQVILRWVLQRDLVVIPKSVTPSRIDQNLDVFGFELSADDMKILNSLNDDDKRMVHLRWVGPQPDYPFNIPY